MDPEISMRLHTLRTQLQACEQGQLAPARLCQHWRETAMTLPLPPRFAQVLGDLLDRLQAGALFGEESCSFSQKDLHASLHLWLDKAQARLDADPAQAS